MSTTLDKIPRDALVAMVDQTRSQPPAVAWASQTAIEQHRPLVLLGSRPAPPGAAATLEHEFHQVERYLIELATEVELAHRGLTVRLAVPREEEARTWLSALDPSLIVVIGRRAKLLPPWLSDLGTDASVARRARCAVVVVPRYGRLSVRRGVVAGVDLTDGSLAVLEKAFGFAASGELPLTVVHWTQQLAADRESELRRQLAEVCAGFREDFPGVHVVADVRAGRPAHELVAASAAAHLLVIGRHRRRGRGHEATGRVSTGIVEQAGCPVMIVPVES